MELTEPTVGQSPKMEGILEKLNTQTTLIKQVEEAIAISPPEKEVTKTDAPMPAHKITLIADIIDRSNAKLRKILNRVELL